MSDDTQPCECHGYPIFDCPNELHRQFMNSMAGVGTSPNERDRQPCPWCDGTGGEAMNPCRRCNGNGDIPA